MKVFTYGVFDLLHVGHIKLLEQAKKLGNYLIVGVFTDSVVESFKRKPIIPLKQRVKMIESLKMVNKVVVLNKILPSLEDLSGVSIVAKAEGAGWDKKFYPKWEKKKSILLKYTKGVSTSDIIKKCASYQ